MDFTMYFFMFPVAIMVATIAMMSGIAGAALFMPIFLLIFPLLGEAYPLSNPLAAITAALITSFFGFSSGYIGYRSKKLIDYKLAISFVKISIPFAFIGALTSSFLNPVAIRLAYGILMFSMVIFLLYGHQLFKKLSSNNAGKEVRTIRSSDGVTYTHSLYKAHWLLTSIGGFLTGLLSTGIGEVTLPQLVTIGKVKVPVAAATSVFVVLLTFAMAALTHAVMLMLNGGFNAVPWNLICYTVPGVLIGGQIGPRLQGKIESSLMTKMIAIVFLTIGTAMIFSVIKG